MKDSKKEIVWDLSALFTGDEDPKLLIEEENFSRTFKEFSEKWRENKKFLTDVAVLKTALDEYEELFKENDDIGKVAYYWLLRSAQDQIDENIKAKKTKAIDVALKVMNSVSFFELELAKVPDSQKEIFLNAPALVSYKHHLEQLFASSKYLLSEKEEQLILQKSIPANDKWVEMVNEFLSQETRFIVNNEGKRVKVGFEDLLAMLSSKTKDSVREEAAKHINHIQKKLAPIATYEINAILLNKKSDDELRGLPRVDKSRLIEDDLEEATVDTLVSTITKRFDIPNRYYKLFAKLIGKERLEYHERNIPFGEIKKVYSYDDAEKVVGEVFKDLDPEFKKMFDSLLSGGLLDMFPRKGKAGGGACYSAMSTVPPYIYMNFTGELHDVTTLAHECGHAMHFILSKKQNALNQGVSKATAEVASTFMEEYALKKLSTNLDDRAKLSLLVTQIASQVGSIFRQIALYNFETDLHNEFKKKLNLSQKEIGDLFLKHMGAYMGDTVKMSKGAENWWVYWSHIRMFFYVYSYASGHLISKALQHMVAADPKNIEKVKAFLSAGQSKSPRDIFLDMGIDIADAKFWEDGLKEIEVQLEEAEKLAEKLGYLK